jgi:hypothetical protein
MEPKPVQHAQHPAYPTRREVLAGAASFVLFGLGGAQFVFAESEDGQTKVAPIFKHGEGRGATGCVVVSPPAFLSEEEALQVVKEELAKHGVQLASGPVLKDVKIASRRLQQVEEDEDGERGHITFDKKKQKIVPIQLLAAPLRITGMDEKRSIGIKFICKRDYEKLGGFDPHRVEFASRDGKRRAITMSTVSSYDLKDVAAYVAAELKKQGKERAFFAVFYDPLWESRPVPKQKSDAKSLREAWKELDKPAEKRKEDSKRLLRQQAQDFVTWLKEQKAI